MIIQLYEHERRLLETYNTHLVDLDIFTLSKTKFIEWSLNYSIYKPSIGLPILFLIKTVRLVSFRFPDYFADIGGYVSF